MLHEKLIQDFGEESSVIDEVDSTESPTIRCAWCRQELSDTASIFSLWGQSTHSAFANPNGQLKVVITFQQVRNYLADSYVTDDFTWFAGYSWQIIYCNTCKAHIGWKYHSIENRKPAMFYGLLEKALLFDS